MAFQHAHCTFVQHSLHEQLLQSEIRPSFPSRLLQTSSCWRRATASWGRSSSCRPCTQPSRWGQVGLPSGVRLAVLWPADDHS